MDTLTRLIVICNQIKNTSELEPSPSWRQELAGMLDEARAALNHLPEHLE